MGGRTPRGDRGYRRAALPAHGRAHGRRSLAHGKPLTGFTTSDPQFAETLRLAQRAAATTSSVLILGETGTGKNRLARLIHTTSPRADRPLVELTCANVPAGLFEAEVFGYEPGAFTDARVVKPGRFEQAASGTLFLDNLAELDTSTQAKLLRVLEDRQFERLGGREMINLDVRVVASLQAPPHLLVAEGRLREDLLYRIDVVRLEIPPLRARPADVRLLAQALLDEFVSRHALSPREISTVAMTRLEAHTWPGNVRELRHAIERAAIISRTSRIEPEDLPELVSVSAPAGLKLMADRGATLAELESAYIDEVLRAARGNKSAAARVLGIHRKTLHDKLRARGRASS